MLIYDKYFSGFFVVGQAMDHANPLFSLLECLPSEGLRFRHRGSCDRQALDMEATAFVTVD